MVSYSELQSFKCIVAGTFGPLHDGHRTLLDTALNHGNTLVGITSDELARNNKDRYVPAFKARKTRVRDELIFYSRKHDSDYAIIKIDDPFDIGLELENLEKIVVTPKDGALSRAKKLNNKRISKSLEPLEIIEAEVEVAEDGGPISSTRIVNMEINQHGELI